MGMTDARAAVARDVQFVPFCNVEPATMSALGTAVSGIEILSIDSS